MRYQDIAEGVKAGTIELDFDGHRTNATRERFIARYEDTLAMSQGKNDGNWSRRDGEKSVEEIDADMRGHYQDSLDWESDPNDPESPVGGFIGLGEEYCFECGLRLKWHWNGKKVQLRQYYNGGYKLTNRCEFEKPEPMKGRINVSSPLMFLNFVRIIDCPKDKEHTDEWSLNCTAGRRRIFDYKWKEQNIAYGQLTNCSYGVYLHPDRESIIIGDPHAADRIIDNMPEEEYDDSKYAELHEKYSKLDGHEMVGSICCDVWRWEAVDVATLQEMFGDDCKDEKHISAERFELEVPHGIWEFAHYYDTQTCDNEHIWAHLKLV